MTATQNKHISRKTMSSRIPKIPKIASGIKSKGDNMYVSAHIRTNCICDFCFDVTDDDEYSLKTGEVVVMLVAAAAAAEAVVVVVVVVVLVVDEAEVDW